MSVIGCITCCVCFSQSQCKHCPRTNNETYHIAIDLSVNNCRSFYKIYCSNIECPIIRDVYRSPESSKKRTLWKLKWNHHFFRMKTWHVHYISVLSTLDSNRSRLIPNPTNCVYIITVSHYLWSPVCWSYIILMV